MPKRRQALLVASATVLAALVGTGAAAVPARASTHSSAVKPAYVGTNIDKGFEGETSCGAQRWQYCLFYSQNVTGAWWGTNQQTFGTITATYPEDGNPGQGQ